ncbi:hypothetical protein AWC38_SpisGene20420 [Stylophora pistillata]|uniref:Uncharacterized protein n=1 Tax=Stylophora pistillata TaxID=50429 RepID=A0A2B4RAK1_STYPI|nr:hypothetical protein AWC38_SpisGene20420 [Stylophora pistillata]
MQLAWLDLRTRDTSVCVHLVTRETTVKKARVILHLRSNHHVSYYNYSSFLHSCYHGLVCLDMSSDDLRVIYYPTVLLRVQIRPKTSTNVLLYLYLTDRLDRFSHIARVTNWIVKKIEEDMETLRIELAQKNMQIQKLQYDLYILKEKYDNETKSLRSEVERGREKVGSLKVEIRRLKEPETDDTISIMRGQPVAYNEKENGEVGVVSNVAIYSLKFKLGKLETETQTLKENVKKKNLKRRYQL